MNRLIPALLLLLVHWHIQGQCYELVWSDEFNYNGQPNPENWTHEVNGDGGGNNELQYYTDRLKNSRVDSGNLIIEAYKENYNGRAYTSARLISYKKASFKYGKIEARIKLPYGQGIWPAFWMLGNSFFEGAGWPACGEIDIMEMVGGVNSDNIVYGTVHWAGPDENYATNGGNKQLSSGILHDDYHVFSIEWTDEYIKWFIDDVQYHIINITESHMSEFHKPAFIILNLAVGGNWPGSPDETTQFPQQMLVDYVRVFQKDGQPFIQGENEVIKKQAGLKYSILSTRDNTYEWQVPDGVEIVSGQGTPELEVNWHCEQDTIKCVFGTSCSTYSLSFPVGIKDATISGEQKIHSKQKNLNYSLPLVSGAEYIWRFPEGVQVVENNGNDVNVIWGDLSGDVEVEIQSSCGSEIVSLSVQAVKQTPYPDEMVPQPIPGKVEAVYYDTGGEGIAYHDTDAGNNGPGIRQNEDVDTEGGDGFGNIGWTETGEWYEYTVDVEISGTYDLEIRTAAQNPGGSFRLYMNGRDISGEIDALSASSWTNYRTKYLKDVLLFDNDSLLRVEIINGLFNLASINFIKTTSGIFSANEKKTILIYPKFCTTQLNVKGINYKSLYQILDVSGKLISSGLIESNNAQLDTSFLQSGIYILRISNKRAEQIDKFIKIE